MDRYEVPIDDHLRPLVEAAERGDEVVILRDGMEVAKMQSSTCAQPKIVDDAFIAQMWAHRQRVRAIGIPPGDAAKLIREMRDEGY